MRDHTGKIFGRLTLLKRRGEFYLCRCACGTEREVRTDRLVAGKTKSCGCYARELNEAARKPPPPPPPPRVRNARLPIEAQLYAAWNAMKSRCSNPLDKSFERYGARGIQVCAEWGESFEQFLVDMLPKYAPGLWLERRDNDRGYSPGNCEFTTPTVQARNRRNTLRLRGGEGLAEWVERTGVPYMQAYKAYCRAAMSESPPAHDTLVAELEGFAR